MEREADGVRVTNWYHRQFTEAARARYCTKESLVFLHTQLADFFSGKWADGEYIFVQTYLGRIINTIFYILMEHTLDFATVLSNLALIETHVNH